MRQHPGHFATYHWRRMTESEVSSRVKKTLMNLELTHVIHWWERLNSGRVKTEYGSWLQLCRPGTPDYILICKNKQTTISIIFIECKSSTGKMSTEQHDFCTRYVCQPYIYYFIISDPSKLAGQILDIAYDRLGDIKYEV